MNDNLKLYNAVRSVPKEAQKSIGGGRLKGMTDINPMWRIKILTEQFGICGVGWKYEVVRMWTEPVANSNEVTANVEINLYVKDGGQWSEAIPGIGGSMLAVNEKNGLYVDDECYKKALTDAISVACKALGVGADVYWDKDRTKYTQRPQQTGNAQEKSNELTPFEKITAICNEKSISWQVFREMYDIPSNYKGVPESRWVEILKEMEGK